MLWCLDEEPAAYYNLILAPNCCYPRSTGCRLSFFHDSNVLSNLYPAYASYKAVLSGDDEQHRQWLSYWYAGRWLTRDYAPRSHSDSRMLSFASLFDLCNNALLRCRVVITIFTVFELFGDRLISWLPLYYESKVRPQVLSISYNLVHDAMRNDEMRSHESNNLTIYCTTACALCTPLPSCRLKIVLVIWLTLPPWRGASVLYNTVIAKHLEALEPDIDHFAASAQQRATVAWADLQHRIASLVTRHAKELLGAAATALASAAATTQRRQIEPATLVDDDGDIDERDTAPRGTAKGQRKVR